MKDSTLAVMQPYFFPYIGYFRLIAAVDTFVSFDDVNFIKKGWIHRNRILLDGKEFQISLQIKKMSQNSKINESFIFEPDTTKRSAVRLVQNAYHKTAPFFAETFPLVESLLLSPEEDIGSYNSENLRKCAEYLDLKTKFIRSSTIANADLVKGKDRILSIAHHLEAKRYINAPGGKQLYDPQEFIDQGVDLKFVVSEPITYAQRNSEFVPNLSIIDVLMFAGREKTKEFLQHYSLD